MSIAVPLYGFGASGGSPNKSTIIVTAPTGSTVTCKMGSTTKTAPEKNGTWTFSGLDIGTWTITATKGSSIATQDVDITRLTVEYVTITYFSATINVTYPAGSTCTCSDGITTFTAPNTSGSWACIVYNAGTWTIAITDGEKHASTSIVVSTSGQVQSIELNYQIWLFKAGDTSDKWQYAAMKINASYPNATEPTVTVDASSMTITQPTYVNSCAYVYNDEVDLTTLDTLSFDGTLSTAMANFADAACLCIWTSLGTYVTDNRVAYINFKTAAPKQIDVSTLTGKHRVGFFLFSNGTYAKVNSLLIE